MLYQNPDSEYMIIVIILVVAIFVFVIMLIATFALFHSEARTKNEIGSKDELKSSSLAGIFARLFLEDGQKDTFKINQRALNLMGVPLTAAAMMGLILVLARVHPKNKVFVDMALEPWFWSILIIFIGIAGGGAIGVRIADLSWRQTVFTALLTGASAMLISRFEISPFYSGPWDSSVGNFQFDTFLIGTLAVSAPAFLLPLCDPILRQSGLTPSREKVVFAALVITCMFVPIVPIAVGVFIGFTCFLLGIGVILSLYRPMETVGAEFGGLGLMLLPISSFAWLAYVSGSFS